MSATVSVWSVRKPIAGEGANQGRQLMGAWILFVDHHHYSLSLLWLCLSTIAKFLVWVPVLVFGHSFLLRLSWFLIGFLHRSGTQQSPPGSTSLASKDDVFQPKALIETARKEPNAFPQPRQEICQISTSRLRSCKLLSTTWTRDWIPSTIGLLVLRCIHLLVAWLYLRSVDIWYDPGWRKTRGLNFCRSFSQDFGIHFVKLLTVTCVTKIELMKLETPMYTRDNGRCTENSLMRLGFQVCWSLSFLVISGNRA